MDVSGKFANAGPADAERQEIARQLSGVTGDSNTFAWRDGQPIAVDLDHPVPESRRSLLPEYLAIAAVFLLAYWIGLSRLIG